jgi:hypothetical protein
MDELRKRLRHEMEDEHAPTDGHERVVGQIRRRARARRLGAGGLGLALTGVLVAGIAAVGGSSADVPDPPGSTGPSAHTAETSPSPEPPSPYPSPDPKLPGAPPPVTVHFLDRSIELHAHTYCYLDGCVDGGPRRPLTDVGTPAFVTVEFPLDGWTFTAFFTRAGDDCARIQSTALSPNADGTFTLRPIGFADDYNVSLFGEAPRGGDLSVAFRWTTPTDGPLPEPRAYLALLSNDDPVTSYGVELHVSNLESTPSSARARITVRASNGREITFWAKAADQPFCLPEGTVSWDGPDGKGSAAAALGDPPFTYAVELFLDGNRYVATATWPADEVKGEEPGVLLDFVPALPAL